MGKASSKEKISITIDKDILKSIEDLSDDRRFRNRSHIIEYCVNKFLEDKDDI
jgi:metal-responsive CopG/Arc/MetJ family transcriptional regulator